MEQRLAEEGSILHPKWICSSTMRALSFFTLLSLLAQGQPALATTARALGLEALAAASDLVVVGQVEAVTPRAVDGGRRIMSLVRLRVTEGLRGEGPAEIEVVLPGGRRGELAQQVPGVPTLRPGERVALFLRLQAPARPGVPPLYRLTAYGLALYRLEGEVASRPLEGLELVGAAAEIEAARRDARLSLEVLRERVRASGEGQ